MNHRFLVAALCAALFVGCSQPTVLTQNGVSITVPPGAIDDPSILNVSVAAGLPAPLPAGVELRSEVYEFTPHGIAFNEAVTIELPFDASGPDLDFSDLGVFRFEDLDTMDFIVSQVSGASFDPAGIANFQTDGFSWYVVGEIGETGDDDDATGDDDDATGDDDDDATGDDDDSTPMEDWQGNLVVTDNADVAGFCDQYVSVSGSVSITGPAVTDIDLSCLQNIGGNDGLVVTGTELTTLNLGALAGVAGPVLIDMNQFLATVDLDSLVSAGNIELAGDPITGLAMGSLSSFGAMSLQLNGLESLDGLSLPTSITGDVLLELSAATGPGAFGAVDNYENLSLLNTLAMTDFMGFNTLTVSDSLSIVGHSGDVTGFQSLTTVGADLSIQQVTGGEVIDIAPGLLSIGETLNISGNDDLVVIDGFAGLDVIGGDLTISDNPQLDSLGGLMGLVEIGGQLSIQDNPNLPQTEIDLLVSTIGSGNIGSLNIGNNGP